MTTPMMIETLTESPRQLRCRLLDGKLNRCANEALSEDGLALCAKHYAAAVADYCRLTGSKLSIVGGRRG